MLQCRLLRPLRHACFRSVATNRRGLLTLAIETSCDDTCVAILKKHDLSSQDPSSCRPALEVHHHAKVTSDNRSTRGIHPVVALASHQQNLGNLVQAALAHLPPFEDNHGIRHENKSLSIQVNGQTKFVKKPDFISVTRGPGMRSNLYTGLDTAKGLSIAWAIPLLAVNHMQAHALTPRLVAASLQTTSGPPTPSFPFLSLLVSGGHTMLLHSKSLNEHRNLAQTSDIAIGDAIDKIARGILPEEVLQASSSTMYGPVLEAFAFPPGEADYEAHREAGREANHEIDYAYTPPPNRTAELARYHSPHGWSFEPPLASTKSGSRNRALEFCFSGIYSSSHRIATEKGESMGIEERRHLARETMRIAFEHLATRVVFALDALREVKLGARGNGDRGGDGGGEGTVKALVVSGGVAANKYLKHILRAYLNARNYPHIELIFPPLDLCTDNAIMIGWTGIEMYEAGWTSELSCQALKKWSLDPSVDGGILGAGGWMRRREGGLV